MRANNSVSRRMAYALRHDLHQQPPMLYGPAKLPNIVVIKTWFTTPAEDHIKPRVLLPMAPRQVVAS